MYRKNTTSILKEWKNYIGKNLNESTMNARQRNECFEALISDLIECGWNDDDVNQERIDMLISVLQRCNLSDEELNMIAYGPSSSSQGAPLEDDDDFDNYDSQEAGLEAFDTDY